jgi:2-polyprenyl-3-methyl-5-hydroxy-6-metoxy-1,4-benzoquinol methylase
MSNSKIEQTPAHDSYNETILNVLKEINPKKIIEIGCMKGSLAKAYKNHNLNCFWHGVDIDKRNTLAAQEHCDTVKYGDIEKFSNKQFAEYRDYETWIFGDVLEHLYNPWAILKKIKENTNGNLDIIASIPNSQHWSFQAKLNIGMMNYENDGLLDRTHIRFFTRQTIIELFDNAGFTIQKMVARNITQGGEKYIPHIREMAKASGADPEQVETDSNAYQYVILANKKRGSGNE